VHIFGVGPMRVDFDVAGHFDSLERVETDRA
jgi:hypothetical protein